MAGGGELYAIAYGADANVALPQDLVRDERHLYRAADENAFEAAYRAISGVVRYH